MLRMTEKAVAAAVIAGHEVVTDSDLWAEMDSRGDEPFLH
jgi:hypothetical protein